MQKIMGVVGKETVIQTLRQNTKDLVTVEVETLTFNEQDLRKFSTQGVDFCLNPLTPQPPLSGGKPLSGGLMNVLRKS